MHRLLFLIICTLIIEWQGAFARDPSTYGDGASTNVMCLKLWDEIEKLHWDGNFEESLLLLDSLNTYATSIDDQQFMAWSLDSRAHIYFSKGQYELSQKMFEDALLIYRKNKKWDSVSSMLVSLISIYKQKGDYKNAFDYVQKAKALISKTTHSSSRYRLYQIQAMLYNNLGQTDSAYYFQSLQLDIIDKTDSVKIANVYNEMADTFIKIYNYNRAEEYSDLALRHLPSIYKLAKTTIWLKKADIHIHNNQVDLARDHANKAKDFLESVNHKVRLISAYTMLALINIESQNYQEAKKYISLVEIKDGYDNKEIESNYSLAKLELSIQEKNIIESKKNYKIAARALKNNDHLHRQAKWKKTETSYFKLIGDKSRSQNALIQHHKLKDSLNKIQRTQIIENLEIKYETEQKENEIIRLGLEKKLSKSKITQQRVAIGGLIGGLGILGSLLFRIFGQKNKIADQNIIISKALSDKDTLLREIHHRVKNNLQVISSLLGIQSRSIKDAKALEAIQEGRSRVHSMSLIHQSLYTKDNLTGIYMPDYIDKLSKSLIQTYNISNESISIETSIDGLTIDVETVVPIGLIVNELISNSLKYAFSDEVNGKIIITLKERVDHLLLSVLDNGIGINIDNLYSNKGSFGHSLIKAFRSKLDATLDIKGDNGTEVIMKIRNYRKY